MKKCIIFITVVILLSLMTSKINSYSENPCSYLIKVTVYDRFGSCANGALVRCIGIGYDRCCNVVNCICGFNVPSSGYYTICASQNNYGGSGNVTVVPGIDPTLITIYLSNQGENCEDCPDSK